MPYGTVQSKKEDYVTVVLERQDMCGDCHACEMLSSKKKCTINCESEISCDVGDYVEINVTKNRFLKATYLMYGVPLVTYLSGVFIGSFMGNVMGSQGEIGGVIGGIVGIAVGYGIIKKKETKKDFQKYLPKIVRKVEKRS